MDRLFRIDLYPHDWILDTARLPPNERGVYIQVVCLIYSNRGPIPNDPKWISGVSGCSTRMAQALVDKLVGKGFLILTPENKITQKRAENELRIKRKSLENSAKGGRNRYENERKSNENNYMDSSDTTYPQSTPPPTPPRPLYNTSTSRDGGDDLQRQSDGPMAAAVNGALNAFGIGGVHGAGADSFDIERHLTDKDSEDIAFNAPGWPLHRLITAYNEGVRSGRRDVPKHPTEAFRKWVPRYTKGRRP